MNFQYYEEIRDGLGHDFLSCLEDAFDRIKTKPLAYRLVYKTLRRTALKRFPYRVFFVLDQQIIVVLAVMHIRKDPDFGAKRI